MAFLTIDIHANLITLFSALATFMSLSILLSNVASPFNNSSRLKSYNSLILIMLTISGSDFPFSQLEIVCLETLRSSATCSCISCFIRWEHSNRLRQRRKCSHHPVWEHGNANVELRIPESSAQNVENRNHSRQSGPVAVEQ